MLDKLTTEPSHSGSHSCVEFRDYSIEILVDIEHEIRSIKTYGKSNGTMREII
jgi:hypothetical protein